MKSNLKRLVICLSVLFSGFLHAGESVVNAQITYIASSPSQCGGDVFIQTSPGIPNCTFAYVKSADSSSDKTYSMLLAAYLAGKNVNVNVATDDNNLCWSASVCKIMSVNMSAN